MFGSMDGTQVIFDLWGNANDIDMSGNWSLATTASLDKP